MNPLTDALIQLYRQLRQKMMERWQRDLPFEELLFDRWERAEQLGFGQKTSVYHLCYVYGDVKVGENTWVGPYTLLDGTGTLRIGSFCSISAGVHIYTHDTVRWALSGGRNKYEYAPVVIEDCCYIGPQTIITKGVTIGAHSVVGANSFVNEDLPTYSVAFGTPCRRRGRVEIMEPQVESGVEDSSLPQIRLVLEDATSLPPDLADGMANIPGFSGDMGTKRSE